MPDIENYKIEKSLGKGATAEVFAAKKLKGGERVALKVFSSFVSGDDQAIKRLHCEVEVMKSLNHPNIVKLLAENRQENSFSLELELVDGSSLSIWAKNHKLKVLEPRLWLLAQIARGLGAAHENGVLHRDLKPENILVSKKGEVKITDFGLARSISQLTMTRSGFLIGSLGYMAPEVINGKRATQKSDLFSFGVLAYELLTGKTPYESETPQGLIKSVFEGQYKKIISLNPLVPPEVAEIIESCLQTNLGERPQSIWSVEAVLMNHLSTNGMLPYCKSLVSHYGETHIGSALKSFHGSIEKEIYEFQEEMNSEKIKKRWGYLATVLSEVFPNDKENLEKLLSLKRTKKAGGFGNGKKLFLLLLIPLFLFVSGVVFWMNSSHNSSLESKRQSNAHEATGTGGKNSNKITNVDKTKIVPLKKEIPKPKSVVSKVKKLEPKAKLVLKGQLKVLVDSDVDVFVNNKYIPPSQLENISLKTGKHLLKMVKPGFSPIVREIKVKTNETTWVRARSGGQ